MIDNENFDELLIKLQTLGDRERYLISQGLKEKIYEEINSFNNKKNISSFKSKKIK